MKMIARNRELMERVVLKARSNDCDIHHAASLMQDYSAAVTAHNRGLISLEQVSKSENALWDFVNG